jgi:L-threonylcarbamoyladenylate synthase
LVIIPQTNEALARIADTITQGGVIAFRTDTFYGLGANPFNRDAVKRITQLKGREDRKPILIVISDREHVGRFVSEPSKTFDLLARSFWPGPLTLIGKALSEVSEEITAGTGTIGLRLPGDDDVCSLVRACGGALTATSANPSHGEPARTAQEVRTYFGDTVDLIVDGGDSKVDRPSTVVDACDVETRLIREGVISWSQIQGAIDQFKTDKP